MQNKSETVSLTAQQLLDEGLCCYNQKNYKGAIFYFENLFKIESNNLDLIYKIVMTLQEAGNYKKSLTYSEMLIDISPGNHDFIFSHAENLFHLQSYIKALPIYAQLQKLYPLNTHILQQILTIYIKQNSRGDINKIRQMLTEVENKTNDSQDEINKTMKVVFSLVEKGNNEEAKVLINSVLLFDADNINANGIYGALLSDEGDHEQALVFLDKIAFENLSEYVNVYAENLSIVRGVDVAISYLKERTNKYPLENESKRLLVDYYFNNREYAKSYKVCNLIKKTYKDDIEYTKKIALSRFMSINEEKKWVNQDKLTAAASALRSAYQLDPEDIFILIQLVNYYINVGELKLAYDLICKAECLDENFEMWAKHPYYAAIRDRESYFKCYIAGRASRSILIDVKKFNDKIWNGEPLKNKNVVILREQGLGDEILCASNYNLIINEAKHVDVFCSPRLEKDFFRIFPKANFHSVIENNSIINLPLDKEHYILSADTIILAGDLATLHFQSTGIPLHKENYFTISETLKICWENKLSRIVKSRRPAVGLIWRSGMINSARSAHYLTDKEVAKIITALPDVEFVSCMYVECKKEIGNINKLTKRKIHEILDLDQKNDFENTAAMLSCLELLVGAYTATLSLAMAVGTPAVAYSADYIKEDGIIEKAGLYYDNLSHISLPIFDKHLRSVAIDAIINSIKTQLKI